MRQQTLASGLRLRAYRPGDAPAIHDAVEANRERLNRWMPWAPYSTEVTASKLFIEESIRQEEEGTGLQRGLFQGKRHVGGVGATIDRMNRGADIGYWIDSVFEGTGAAREAVEVLIEHLVREERMHRLVIRAAVRNTRSRTLAERLGFSLEGILRESLILEDTPTDAAIYSMLAGEWAERPSDQ